jgi:hypothetical protein
MPDYGFNPVKHAFFQVFAFNVFLGDLRYGFVAGGVIMLCRNNHIRPHDHALRVNRVMVDQRSSWSFSHSNPLIIVDEGFGTNAVRKNFWIFKNFFHTLKAEENLYKACVVIVERALNNAVLAKFLNTRMTLATSTSYGQRSISEAFIVSLVVAASVIRFRP